MVCKTQLEVFADRIIVKSPGEPIHPITIESLNNFTATSYSRNKKITFILNEMDYMEESALGMDTFRSIGKKHKLPLPVFKYDGLNTVVTFPRNIEAVRDIGSEAIKELTNEELEGYEWIKSQVEISAKDYTTQFGMTPRTTSRHLGKMLDLKLIKTNGELSKSPKLRYSRT